MTKLKLIHAGLGGMGKAWRDNATSTSPDFEVVAVVDPSEKALHEGGDHLKVPPDRRFADLKLALAAVPAADAVLTVTPPAVHVEHARLTFAHGLHLLTEKPIADTLDSAKLMVKLARDAGRQLSVAQNYRFGAAAQTLRRVMDEKPVGPLGHGHVDFYIAADFTGTFRESMEFPLLVDMAIHHLDLIRAVTGRNIARVTAMSFRPDWSWYRHEAGLKMLMQLDDGTPFSYSGDWSARGRQTKWNGQWRLQCAEGSVHLDADDVYVERGERWGKDPSSQHVSPAELTENGQARLLRDFAAAIRGGTPTETSGADNLWSFAAVIAGVTSARECRPVDVPELLAG